MTMEALDRAGKHPANQTPEQQKAIGIARQVLTSFNVVDPGPKIEVSSIAVADAPAIRTSEAAPLAVESDGVLNQAIAELKANPFSPEANTNYERARLRAKGKVIGLEVIVPACDWTEAEIRRPMKDKEGKEVPPMMIYLPDELMGQEGLVKLGQMYPKMGSSSVQGGTTVQDSSDANKKGGWIKVEATVDAPNLNTTQGDLEKHAKKTGYFPQRENVYILAAQKSEDLGGCYFDEGQTWSRLGSRVGGSVVSARFDPNGTLGVDWGLDPRDRDANLGGRFEEVKKA